MLKLENCKMPKLPSIPKMSDERKESLKKSFSSAKKTASVVAKYGLTFSSGVLIGVVAGVVLFFKISEDDI